MARWRIDIIGKKLKHVGTTDATDAAEAVDIAIREHRIDPTLRGKITVTKVSEKRG